MAEKLYETFEVTSALFIPTAAANSERGIVSFAGENDHLDETEIAVLALQSNRIFNRLVNFQSDIGSEKSVPLSERELQCLRLLAAGLATGRIANEIGLSEHTVNHHITTLSHKLGAKNRAHAVSIGFRLNILR